MSQFSPNLKPKNLHTHIDKARHMGVPKGNVLDLRKSDTHVKAAEQIKVQPLPEHAKKIRSQRKPSRLIRPVLAFMIVCIILVLPFGAIAMYQHIHVVRGNVIGLVRDALVQLNQGKQSASDLDFTEADQAFTEANIDFQTAQQQLDSTGIILTTLAKGLPSTKVQLDNVAALLRAGQHITTASAAVTQALKILSDLKAQPLTDVLVAVHTSLRPAIPELHEAATALTLVNVSALPEEYRNQVQQAQTILPTIQRSADQLMSLSDTLITLLGAKEDKRYLVLFMNNRELRACSGFIGSFAQVDITKGKVTKMDIPGGGTYDMLGNFTQNIIAPQPLHRVNAAWQMQDANWWPDCSTSFKKVEWFYTNSGGATVDGVIGLTPDVVEKMLAITGSIDMTDPYGVVIDKDNFYQITQTLAEQKYDETKTSKQIIADLTPKLLDKLFSLEVRDYAPVLQLLYQQLNEKNIILYFNDQFIQQDIQNRGWAGQVKTAPHDYLQVVDTNIAGGKTSKAIEQTIHHQADIQADGSVIDTVTVTRSHYGKSGDVFEDVNNLSYLRFYVPQGSTLLQADGFSRPDPKLELQPTIDAELDSDLQAISGAVLMDETSGMRTNTEFNKTVFGNWIEVRPGETAIVTIKYQLPPSNTTSNTTYSLMVQKQPGSFTSLLISEVTYPSAYSVQWSYPSATQSSPAGQQRLLNVPLQTDVITGLVLAK